MKKVSKASRPSKGEDAGVPQSASAPRSEKDFVILCPSAADSLLVQAALYFLPSNYKLRVLADAWHEIMPFADDKAIIERISFGSKAELANQAALLSRFNAVIYSDEPEVVSEATAPRVVISRTADTAGEGGDKGNFTVPFDSPEAVASAMLRIARTSYA